MKYLLQILLCGILLPVVLSTNFNGNSVVITMNDVMDGLTGARMVLIPGNTYRVYAVYASTGIDSYAQNVFIKGADNTQFSVYDLAKAKADTGYVLSDSNLLTAPITITDTNKNPATGFLIRTPFTIYIVSTEFATAPVLSAQLTNGQVDSKIAMINSPSCTLLSAEQSVMLDCIDIGSLDQVEVKTTGYDELDAWNTVFTIRKDSIGRSVTISGPIATLYNSNGQNANFSFALPKDGSEWSGNLLPGASITFLSNGWLSTGESYNVDYQNDNVRTRNYHFGRDTLVTFAPTVGRYYPSNGESIKLSCRRENGDNAAYNLGDLDGQQLSDWCETINLHVDTQAPNTPQFKIVVESGSLSLSIYVLLIASFANLLSK